MDQDISMAMCESIIHINEGDVPSTKTKCFFCKEDALFSFGIIDNKKQIKSNNQDCFVMKSVTLCSQHAEAFNSLLSGDHDINDLIVVLNKTTSQRRLNLRRK